MATKKAGINGYDVYGNKITNASISGYDINGKKITNASISGYDVNGKKISTTKSPSIDGYNVFGKITKTNKPSIISTSKTFSTKPPSTITGNNGVSILKLSNYTLPSNATEDEKISAITATDTTSNTGNTGASLSDIFAERTLPTGTTEEIGENGRIANFKSALDQIMSRANSAMVGSDDVTIEGLRALSNGSPLPPSMINNALKNTMDSRQDSIMEMAENVLSVETAKIKDDMEKRKEMLDYSFDDNVLRSGFMPTNLPEEYQEIWKLSSEGFASGESQLSVDQKLRMFELLDNPSEYIKSIEGGTLAGGSISIPKSSRLAFVNNNPGNVMYVGQAGATEGENGFAKWSTPEAGWNGMIDDLNVKLSGRGQMNAQGHGDVNTATLADMISVYYPPTGKGNSQAEYEQYVQQISQWTGYTADTKLKDMNSAVLAPAFAKKESQTTRETVEPIFKKDAEDQDWVNAENFINSNPTARDEELLLELLRMTKNLSKTEITSLLDNRDREYTDIDTAWFKETFPEEDVRSAIADSRYADAFKRRGKEVKDFYKKLDELGIEQDQIQLAELEGWDNKDIIEYFIEATLEE